jgi:dolichol-phosphate mannosyltransferase
MTTQLSYRNVHQSLVEAYNIKVVVVLPTFNEAENIKTLIPAIQRVLGDFDMEIVVVDDNSWDGTSEIAKDFGAIVVQRGDKGGLGSAIRKGVRVALEYGGDVIVQMDADWQHDPGDIPRVLKPILNGECSLALGSRNFSRKLVVKEADPLRDLVSNIARLLANFLLGLRSADPTSGFRSFDRFGAQAILNTLEDGYAFQVEAFHNARKMNLGVTEIPIKFGNRFHGESKLDLSEALRYLIMLFKCFLDQYKKR